MQARFDHLVIAVPDLDEAVARWSAAGISAVPGGRHPVGTVNALVRGPQRAYVELIAAGSAESNPWLDRVRSAAGPISWAIALDDVDAAREVLVTASFSPQPVAEGSRLTPDGDTVAWRMCDVGAWPYGAGLPFLIQWTTPMPPGPADGPAITHVALTPPDPERVADLLLALGFVADASFPRRAFRCPGVGITLQPVGDPVPQPGTAYVSAGTVEPTETTVSLDLPVPDLAEHRLDGVVVWSVPDRRRHPAAILVPAVDEAFAGLRGDLGDWPDPRDVHPAWPTEEAYSRIADPGKYRLLGARADAWLRVIADEGLGRVEDVVATHGDWASPPVPPVRRTVRATPVVAGALPLLVAHTRTDEVPDFGVVVGVGRPAHHLATIPGCGCDACDDGSAHLLGELDDAFLLALGGGVPTARGAPWL